MWGKNLTGWCFCMRMGWGGVGRDFLRWMTSIGIINETFPGQARMVYLSSTVLQLHDSHFSFWPIGTCWKVVIITRKKETLEWLSLVWGIPDIPMTNPEITLTNTDGNNLHDWQIHFLFDFPSNLWRRRDRLLPRYPWRARDQSWGVTSVGVPASNPQSSAWTLGQRLRDMFFPPSHATVPRPCPQEEDITMLGENPMQSFSLHDLQVFLSSLLITRAYFYNWGWQSCWGR